MLNPIRKSFGSDNHAGVHEAVLAAVARANTGDVIAYGDDDTSRRARELICQLSGASQTFLVFNGTAANVLGISLMLRPHEGVICAETSHLNVDECGAAERVLGTKLLTVQTQDGKLTPELIRTRLTGRGDEHRVQARVVQIAQVTELGTCYSLAELRALRDFCSGEGLRVYIDGARIANAVAHLGCSLADIAACADVLSFGGTKNGAMGVEAVLVMTDRLAADAPYFRKQQMQLSSKMRFLSAQLIGLLEDDLWLRNAQQANAMASRLAAGLSELPGIRLAYPMESNGVFAELSTGLADALHAGWNSHVWAGGEDGRCVVRLMTAYDTSEADVDDLVAAVKAQS